MLLSDAPQVCQKLEPGCNRRVHWSSRVGPPNASCHTRLPIADVRADTQRTHRSSPDVVPSTTTDHNRHSTVSVREGIRSYSRRRGHARAPVDETSQTQSVTSPSTCDYDGPRRPPSVRESYLRRTQRQGPTTHRLSNAGSLARNCHRSNVPLRHAGPGCSRLTETRSRRCLQPTCSAFDCHFRSHFNRRCMKVLSFTLRDASAMRRSSPGRMLVL